MGQLLVGVIILGLLNLVSAGPRSTCPGVLSYVKDHAGSFYGLIKIQQSPMFENEIGAMHLQVILANYDKDIKYLGKVDLLMSLGDAYANLIRGKPLIYKLTPPSTNNFDVSSITMNDKPYCQQNTYSDDPISFITLDNSLVPKGDDDDHLTDSYDTDHHPDIQYSHQDNYYEEKYSKLNKVCGKPSRSKYDLLSQNNQVLEAKNWPWLASIFLHKNNHATVHVCAGTLITNRHVLTAGRCIKPEGSILSPDEFIIGLGISDDLDDDSYYEVRGYQIYHKHGLLADETSNLVIFELENNVRKTPSVQPICVWSDSSKEVIGQTGYVVAWSRDEDGTIIPFELRLTKLTVKPNNDCRAYDELFKLPTIFNGLTNTFCAGENLNTGYCTGHIGSALVVYDYKTNAFFLRGVLARVIPKDKKLSCHSPQYAEFIDTSQYIEWIEETTL
ncbi:hypothetical protein HCN44_005781 [Aphidius gifuensis]|uniref:Peptidase S1 domain-containing protein n=1 Tax=Aphidius gifuensis TaxID=684658 RepID=A0A834XT59_APHGI|nr:serine protease 48-like [Aphidius gifuensis]KAF7993000.1 hypothetical protein HCN44_005781 [Aphidius gifuensis]